MFENIFFPFSKITWSPEKFLSSNKGINLGSITVQISSSLWILEIET